MQRPEEELLRSSKMTVPLICLQKQMVNISLKVKKIPTFPLQQQVIHRLWVMYYVNKGGENGL